jgi:hypothetical protein
MRETLSFPPFPELYDTGLGWQGSIVLKTWAGFRADPVYWCPVSMSKVSDGTVKLAIAKIVELMTPSPEQSAAYQFLTEHEEIVHHSVLQGIFDDYPTTRQAYGYDKPEGNEDPMPDLQCPDDLKMLIGLDNIVVSRVAKSGFAYLTFQFNAAWDPEHPFEVTTHKERVVMVSPGAGEYHAEADAQIG